MGIFPIGFKRWMLCQPGANMVIKRTVLVIALIGFSFLLYSDTFQNEFHFDDYVYIINAPEIRHDINIFQNLYTTPFFPDRSLVQYSFSLNYALNGLSYPGYQLVNILIHAINAFLLFLIINNLLPQSFLLTNSPGETKKKLRYVPVVLSFLFVAHPLAVNSVAYIAQRHGLMATLFYLSAFFVYLKAMAFSKCYKWILLGIVSVFFVLSIHSKPMAVSLPLLLIIAHFILFREQEKRVATTLLMPVALLVVFVSCAGSYALYSGILTESALTAGFKSNHLWSSWVQFMTESEVFLQYWKLLLFPFPSWLCADRAFSLSRSIDFSLICSWLFHSMLLMTALFTYKKGFKLIPVGILWFYVTLSPYLFIPVQDVMVEYKTYLPSVAF